MSMGSFGHAYWPYVAESYEPTSHE